MYTYGKGLGTALTEMYARRIIEMNIDFEKIRKEEWPDTVLTYGFSNTYIKTEPAF